MTGIAVHDAEDENAEEKANDDVLGEDAKEEETDTSQVTRLGVAMRMITRSRNGSHWSKCASDGA